MAAALDRVVSLIPVEPVILPDVLDTFPPRPDLVLGPVTLTLTSQLVDHIQRSAADDPASYEPALALSLNNLSLRLAEAGRREEGLAAIVEAVEVYRRLAAADPAAYEPALAPSLNNLSLRVAEAGRRREEGLTAIIEAVQVTGGWWRSIAAFEPDLARSLTNLSDRLAEAGREEDAAKARREAVELQSCCDNKSARRSGW